MKLEWKTEKRKVSELIPADYNPRLISEKDKEDLKESIKEFDQVVPIVINTNGKLIGGHQRCTVYADLGIEEVEVRVPNRELTLIEEKRLNLRLNKNVGEWDFEKLSKFNIETLLDVGFGDDELSNIWNDAEMSGEEKNIDKQSKDVIKTDIKYGDIFELGSQKLMCGDSTIEEDVKKLMGEDKADMFYCDPPYNIGLDYSGGVSTDNKYKGDTKKMVNDSKGEDEYMKFILSTVVNAINVSKKDVHAFYWCDEKFIWLIQTIFKGSGIQNKRVCLWIKNNFNMTPQIAFNKVYEPCVYGVIGRPYLNKNYRNLNEVLNKEIESGNQVHDEITDLFNIWIVRRENAQDYEHPTQKPITLHEKPLKRTTRVGDVVLDLFGGSGSTLMACEQMERKSRLMELDPIFCQVIINRWEAFTGKKANKISSL